MEDAARGLGGRPGRTGAGKTLAPGAESAADARGAGARVTACYPRTRPLRRSGKHVHARSITGSDEKSVSLVNRRGDESFKQTRR